MSQDQKEISNLLEEKFQQRKSRNKHYSLRAFARDLGINSGALSEILKGKRKVSKVFAIDLAEKLNLDDKEEFLFMSSFRTQEALEQEEKNRYIQATDASHINTLEHFFVLTSLKLTKIEHSFEGLREFLAIEEEKLQSILDDLTQYGLIELTDSGTYSRLKENVRIPRDPESEVLYGLSKQTLGLVKNNLLSEDTIFQTLIVPGESDIREKIQKIMDDGRKEVSVMASDTLESDRLYLWGGFFFPVT